MIPGYAFRDAALLEEALTHPSLAHERPGLRDYERLEFLGDAVLQLVVTELLMHTRPVWREGRMSEARRNVVNMTLLAEVSEALGLPALLRVAPGQQEVVGQSRVWSRVFESVLGAIYEDGGWEAARAWARPLLEPHLDRLADVRDPITRLQEWAQKQRVSLHYHLVDETGEAHRRHFAYEVFVGGEVRGRGEGSSKKLAKKAAAEEALERVRH